jgi:hypothetical protein
VSSSLPAGGRLHHCTTCSRGPLRAVALIRVRSRPVLCVRVSESAPACHAFVLHPKPVSCRVRRSMRFGIAVLRFTNTEIFENIDAVLRVTEEKVRLRPTTSPAPSFERLSMSQVLRCWTRSGVARWGRKPPGALPRADEWLPRWGGRPQARRAPGTLSPERAAIHKPRATPWARAPHERGQNRPCPAWQNLGKDQLARRRNSDLRFPSLPGTVDFLSDRSKSCHPERSEGSRDVRSGTNVHEILRFAQNDIGCLDAAKRTLGCLSTLPSQGRGPGG